MGKMSIETHRTESDCDNDRRGREVGLEIRDQSKDVLKPEAPGWIYSTGLRSGNIGKWRTFRVRRSAPSISAVAAIK